MANILERTKDLKPKKKTAQEHAEDALYREVWEDVNNEKTQQFLKKYGKHLIAGAIAIVIIAFGIQIARDSYRKAKLEMAAKYEIALQNADVNGLMDVAKNAKGGTADLALFNAYMISGDVAKLEMLAKDGKTRDYRDLAKIHLIGIRGDDMSAADVEKFLADLDTKSSPFYYTACLTIAQKYIATGDKESAKKRLNKIINDADAPATIRSDAEMLR